MNGALKEGCAVTGNEVLLVAGIRNSLKLTYTQRGIQDLGCPPDPRSGVWSDPKTESGEWAELGVSLTVLGFCSSYMLWSPPSPPTSILLDQAHDRTPPQTP